MEYIECPDIDPNIQRSFVGERIVFSTNSSGTIGYPYALKNILHDIQTPFKQNWDYIVHYRLLMKAFVNLTMLHKLYSMSLNILLNCALWGIAHYLIMSVSEFI